MYNKPIFLMSLSTVLGCTGEIGATGAEGADGLSVLIKTEAEAAGDNCENGGVLISSGIDSDSDGVLSEEEVGTQEYVCNGTAGIDGETGVDGETGLSVLVETAEEPPGENCENGGVAVHFGIDSNADGVLDEDEITEMEYICNGVDETADPANMLVTESEYIGEGNAECPGGYILIEFGYDLDMSDSLEGAEVETSFLNCNPVPELEVDNLTFIDDCGVDSIIPVTLSDVNGTVDAVSVSISVSGSSFVPTIDLSGNLTIPSGAHQSGAILSITATDNFGAESTKDITIGFIGTGCLATDTFHGVQADTCESIDVNNMAGDDRGGVTVTSDYAYYNGDNGLVRTDLDLGNLTIISNYDVDTLIGDPLTGTLYTLWSSTFTYTNLQDTVNNDLEDNSNDVVFWDQLAIIDENTFEVLSTVTLESPVYVPNYSNQYEFDFGEGAELDSRTKDIMVGMRGDHILIANKIYGNSSDNQAIEMRLVDAVTGLNISSTMVYDLSVDPDDNEAWENLEWDEQEVDIQHYLLLERGGDHFITYRQGSTAEMIEVNVSTGAYTTVSTTFGTAADMNNLALDSSGLYVYFHTEDGFSQYREESMDKCMILFSENNGTEYDSGGGY